MLLLLVAAKQVLRMLVIDFESLLARPRLANAPCCGLWATAARSPYKHVCHTHVHGRTTMTRYAELKQAAQRVPADVIVMVPNDTVAAHPLTANERERFLREGVVVYEVPWILPPGMRFTRPNNSCGFQDFARLHAFGIDGYDAIISLDSDVFVRSDTDMSPVFRCAAQNRILGSGGPGLACNIGFVAFRPDPRLLAAAVNFAQEADYDAATGWDRAGWAPSKSKFSGSDCGQGRLFNASLN
jgi:hypothetical protein